MSSSAFERSDSSRLLAVTDHRDECKGCQDSFRSPSEGDLS